MKSEELKFTSTEACSYAQQGRLSEWVDLFFRTAEYGKNILMAEGFRKYPTFWKGPVDFDISQLTRKAGPETEMEYQQDTESWNQGIEALKKLIEEGVDFPPLFVHVHEGKLDLADGAHRLEAFMQSGKSHHFVIFYSHSEADLDSVLV